MKRILLAVITCAVMSFAVAPVFADEPDFKTSDGIKKFWDKHTGERGGDSGGGGN
jgi:hypothetical protein